MSMKDFLVRFFSILVLATVFSAGCITADGKDAGYKITKVQAHSGIHAPSDLKTQAVGGNSPFIFEPLLTRPTDDSVDISIVPARSLTLFIDWKEAGGPTYTRTPPISSLAEVPTDILISGLKTDTYYLYRVGYQLPGSVGEQYCPESSFHTARVPGSSFVFDIQADSHLDARADGDLYTVAVQDERADHPDFLIDLGDTFMTDKLPSKDNRSVLMQYLNQRRYLSSLQGSVPLFLVPGNHDGEAGWQDNGAASLARLSLSDRKEYFPGPEPGGFYTGDQVIRGPDGLLEDYYAWNWGDALFVVLDPYWFTTTKPGGRVDGWGWTLGDTQYQWLKKTLEESHASYKFVFSHQLVGGNDTQGRGGTEYADLYEWGGHNPDGTWGFSEHRPGWQLPIHQILVENHVTAFFHGHDHFFCRQELDGVIYQEVPQPATISSRGSSPGTEYGYVTGVARESPGYLRVNVSPVSARVDYIRTALPGQTPDGLKNGMVVYSYTVQPCRQEKEAVKDG